jgi:hypothetical protein
MRVTPTAQGNQRFIRMQAKLGHCGMCSRVVNYLFLAGYIVMSVPLLSFFWFAAHVGFRKYYDRRLIVPTEMARRVEHVHVYRHGFRRAHSDMATG